MAELGDAAWEGQGGAMSRQTENVIWDFNGTLVDDLDLVVRTVNTQLGKRGLPSLTEAEYRDVFGFPVKEYYRRIGVDFGKETMAELSADFFAEYGPALRKCSLHPGVERVLQGLWDHGVRQFVLSAMEEALLHEMLRHLGISRYFEAMYGLSHQEADSKISRGHELLRDHGIEPHTTLLIGDTLHDAEVAGALGVTPVLVAQGHQSLKKLKQAGCAVFETLEKLSHEDVSGLIKRRPDRS
jgi:phosphoglycolate phosphatase